MFCQNLMNEFANRKPALRGKLFKSFLLALGKPDGHLNGKRVFFVYACTSKRATRTLSFSASRHTYPQSFQAIKITTAMMIPLITFFRISLELFDIKPPLRVKYK